MRKMTSPFSFRWLHLSDLHVGMNVQNQLWPRSSTLLLDDLETAYRKTGGFDCIIFSGDLVQKGTKDEFDRFDKVIDSILNRISEFGPVPPLITVPGNHDLIRPDPVNPFAMAFAQYWSNPTLQEGMWKTNAGYIDFLNNTFKYYLEWQDRAISRGIHIEPSSRGILPGDASYIVETCSSKTGLIALNSTWLQLGGGDYTNQLHVDTRQILAVTDGSPDDWARNNDVNLLITHQPASWIRSDKMSGWDNDVNPSGRFDAHLYGHMHKPDMVSISHGGGRARRHVQAASLFGLETYGDGVERIQGYSSSQISGSGSARTLTSWPRRMISVSDSKMKIAPDSQQDINEDTGSYQVDYHVDRRLIGSTIASADNGQLKRVDGHANIISGSSFNLTKIQLHMLEAKAHTKVRRVEQNAIASAFDSHQAAWLASDWGMGKDGFIFALCDNLNIPHSHVYSVDFSGFSNDPSFIDNMRTLLGGSFQEMFEAISDIGSCIFVLDDVDVSSSPLGTEERIEKLIDPLKDFAAEARIIIRSRRRPRRFSLPVVELKPLDEPDVAIYVRDSELGSDRYAKPDAVSLLYRHTDGVPSRIDDALRDLEIISLGDLMTANPDYGDSSASVAKTPPALIASVSELASSDDRAEERAYKLLLALASLPQGERLSRLTRFLGPHPFLAPHARTLLERSLIDTSPIQALEGMPGDDTQKVLIVPRPVREYVRLIMEDETSRLMDRKALELYFGDEWSNGEIRNSPIGKRVKRALCDGYEIQNAGALIVRSTRRALSEGNNVDAEGLIRLASAFIESLMSGDHFRAAVSLCEDMILSLEQFGDHEHELNILKYELARGLRMIGRAPESQSTLQDLNLNLLSKPQRQRAELNLALVAGQVGDDAAAAAAARRVLAIDKKSVAAIHAKTILAEQIADPEEKILELKKLLVIARREEITTLINTILLNLSLEEDDEESATSLLSQIINSPEGGQDTYNNVRAIVSLAGRHLGPEPLSQNNRIRLLDAYHFLYNERMGSLFDRCHAALWTDFERSGEIFNLLNLFRHSSFIWRIAGKLQIEEEYLMKLTRHFRKMVHSASGNSSRDEAYFFVRVSVIMDESPSASDEPIT
ncbi:metallophosphoesterase [Sphingomonas sp. Xoc002]|uniref:metallophosphoesterase n=1 Tax=Sphingomonas sp. Xoc002 TaxID=2837624 RepID=UPI003D172C7A